MDDTPFYRKNLHIAPGGPYSPRRTQYCLVAAQAVAAVPLVLRTAIAPPVWRDGLPAILLVHRTQKLVKDLRRAPLGVHSRRCCGT